MMQVVGSKLYTLPFELVGLRSECRGEGATTHPTQLLSEPTLLDIKPQHCFSKTSTRIKCGFRKRHKHTLHSI